MISPPAAARAACLLLLVGAGLAVPPPTARGQEIDLEPPGPREFLLDRADLLDEETEVRLRTRLDALLTETATPIVVVTIPSLAAMGEVGEGSAGVDFFARRLFDQWGVGQAKVNGRDRNTGILLVVSPGDRAARIELGAGWGHAQDATALRIMDEYLVPNFRRERYAQGVEEGVKALDAMARDKPLPTRPTPWWVYAVWAAVAGLGVFTVASLIRRGASGWAWAFWAVVFAAIGWILYEAVTNRGSGGGGSFGGGSFGGGFSGGGGASGSW